MFGMMRISRWAVLLVLCSAMGMVAPVVQAQQLLGSIEGTVTDASGAALPQVQVTARNAATNLERDTVTNNTGAYRFFDMPPGSYAVSLSKADFESQVHRSVTVVANRTTTENVSLKVGSVSETMEVTATNQLNQVDTTNGYVLGESILQNSPLGTGSFTQLAILSPGVNADLLGGSGSNSGLGNQAIWANGQRDTSNSFTLNAISGNNLFNGKSTSQISSNRTVLNTGENFSGSGEVQTSTSVYDAIGQSLPSPPVETMEELRVNASMFDASQGANSGAHIGAITKSGSNALHGQAYEYFQNSFWNAAPYFRNANTTIPAGQKVPSLHYNRFGATLGGPIIKDRLFFFASYQGIRVSDALLGTAQANVPLSLTNDRSPAGLIAVAQNDFGTTLTSVDPVALALLQKKNKDGSYFIPNPQITDAATAASLGYDTLLQGPPSRFHADQANANLDYNVSARDRISAKYYYQHSPTTNPFASQGGGGGGGGLPGFPQQLDSGAQVISLDNSFNVNPNVVWEQRFGFVRQKAFARTAQPFGPSDFGINLFGSKIFPGITIDNNASEGGIFSGGESFGPVSNFSNAGMFQSRYSVASDLNLVHGRHNIALGFNWDAIQLRIRNLNNQTAGLEFRTFSDFLSGNLRLGQQHSVLFNGTSNRNYRANEVGGYIQDNLKVTRSLNLTMGIRYDFDGPLSEENGLLTNFDPTRYSYNLATDTITNIGLVVAGNNKTFPTRGVNNSTLNGRQWGVAPRVGVAWSPSHLKNIVFRGGFGIFYDRGQFFTELSPSAGFGFNGPFGVTLEPPFVVPVGATTGATFTNPFGATAPPPPPGDLSSVAALIPNLTGLKNGSTPFLFGGYNPNNSLPYSMNYSFDMQWQPISSTVVTIGYTGNHGSNLTQPIPFNQPKIATASNSVNGETSSYGYQPTDSVGGTLLSEPYNTSTGGNTDLRVPYVGFSPNSVFWTANGISNYNALEVSVNRRFTHSLQISASYTWSHTLDEQSGLGLFYNGNNPLTPHSAYASSDFDRTHVATIHYYYELPKVANAHGLVDKLVNGWGSSGLLVFESGQPYNVYDFSGSVGSLYYSANDFITNPIVPLAPGFTPQSAQQHGNPGANPAVPSLNAAAFAIPQLAAGQSGVPACGPTTSGATLCDNVESLFSNGGRNIFRGPFQSRVDFSLIKNTRLSERFNLKYSADFFNLFNHTSFDTPNNNVTFNPCFNPQPCYTVPPQGQLGLIQHTIGSPRFIQMALHLEW